MGGGRPRPPGRALAPRTACPGTRGGSMQRNRWTIAALCLLAGSALAQTDLAEFVVWPVADGGNGHRYALTVTPASWTATEAFAESGAVTSRASRAPRRARSCADLSHRDGGRAGPLDRADLPGPARLPRPRQLGVDGRVARDLHELARGAAGPGGRRRPLHRRELPPRRKHRLGQLPGQLVPDRAGDRRVPLVRRRGSRGRSACWICPTSTRSSTGSWGTARSPIWTETGSSIWRM
jgi:hypothetical protein